MRSSRRLEFTDEARTDLRTLVRYTNAKWGAAQRDAYADRIVGLTHDLLAHPYLGSARDDIAPGLRSLYVGQHVIFYRVFERSIRVDRILHVRMDPARHLRDHP